VEHVHRIRERRHVKHAVFQVRVNPNLAHAGSDRRHRLPVIRVKSLLDAVQLEAGIGEDDYKVRKDIALIRSVSTRYPQMHPIPAHDASAFRMIPVFPASAR
jgi:hypothetical protein